MRACVALVASLLTAFAQVPSPEAVRDRLDAYLSDYEPRLSALVAVEKMSQANDERFNETLRIPEPGRTRRIEAEIAFVSLPGDSGLLGFRRVVKVDGKTVDAPGASLTMLLQTTEPTEVAKQLLQQTARFNLGSTRSTNLPSLPVELLHPRHRRQFSHTVTGRASVRGTAVTVLVAEETARPSIIRSAEGADLPARVTAWVDAEGRLLRAEVASRLTTTSSAQDVPTMRVEFESQKELDLLVPVEMREEYWDPVERSRGKGVARYSEYRRFQTSARIVPPPGQAPGPPAASAGAAALPASCADTHAIVQRAIAYVARFGQELGTVVATEDYRQEVVGPPEAPQYTPPPIAISPGIQVQPAAPMTKTTAVTQRLRSAFLFVPFADDQVWAGYRDVLEVNGRRTNPERGRASLDVAGDPPLERWRRISDESARHNIGTVTRTLNVPTFALLALHAAYQPRFAFTPAPPLPGTASCNVAFQETESPTIVRNAVGGDVPASGTFRVEPDSGRVEQSELMAGSTSTGVALKATVRYERDGTLQLWVPREMREEYVTRTGERLQGVARYSDYRRAEVTAKVRPD